MAWRTTSQFSVRGRTGRQAANIFPAANAFFRQRAARPPPYHHLLDNGLGRRRRTNGEIAGASGDAAAPLLHARSSAQNTLAFVSSPNDASDGAAASRIAHVT
jgi:hypothetical protein